MSSDQEQRLITANRQLLTELTAACTHISRLEAFLQSLRDPEQLGHAVTPEVRQAAAKLIRPAKSVPLASG